MKESKGEIKDLAEKSFLLNQKRDTQPKHPMVVDCLVRWLRDIRANHVKTVPMGTQDLMLWAEM